LNDDDDDGRYNEVFNTSKKEYKIRKFRNRASKKHKKEAPDREERERGGGVREKVETFFFFTEQNVPTST
jgi:hypothetical protein